MRRIWCWYPCAKTCAYDWSWSLAEACGAVDVMPILLYKKGLFCMLTSTEARPWAWSWSHFKAYGTQDRMVMLLCEKYHFLHMCSGRSTCLGMILACFKDCKVVDAMVALTCEKYHFAHSRSSRNLCQGVMLVPFQRPEDFAVADQGKGMELRGPRPQDNVWKPRARAVYSSDQISNLFNLFKMYGMKLFSNRVSVDIVSLLTKSNDLMESWPPGWT